MSKRSNRSNKHNSGRGFKTTASSLPQLSPLSDWNKSALLNLAKRAGIDNRYFTPVPSHMREYGLPRTKTVYGSQAPIKQVWSKSQKLSPKYIFADPKTVTTCVRRQTRKEVLHAQGFAGRKLGYRRSNRSESSYISCKKG